MNFINNFVPMKRYLIIVVLLCLFGSLHADFYRTKSGRYIADVAFSGKQVLVLENRYTTSALCLLDLEGNKLSETEFQTVYEELLIDCFGDCLLMNQDSCLQVVFDHNLTAKSLARYSKKEIHDRLLRVVLEYNGAYVLRDLVYDPFDYHVQELHGQTQTYTYVRKDDPSKEIHPLCRFVNTEAVKTCQSCLNEIIAMYNHEVPPKANVLRLGKWDGNLLRLAQTVNIRLQVYRYKLYVAKEYHTEVLKHKGNLQLIDLQLLQIVEVDKGFKTSEPRPLKVTYGDKYFDHQLLIDEVTSKAYGLFVRDGMNYLGLYNPDKGTVSMGQKASTGLFPKVFKVHGGYAYSVFFDRDRKQGTLSRVKLNE